MDADQADPAPPGRFAQYLDDRARGGAVGCYILIRRGFLVLNAETAPAQIRTAVRQNGRRRPTVPAQLFHEAHIGPIPAVFESTAGSHQRKVIKNCHLVSRKKKRTLY
jgi:hypothetical protein